MKRQLRRPFRRGAAVPKMLFKGTLACKASTVKVSYLVASCDFALRPRAGGQAESWRAGAWWRSPGRSAPGGRCRRPSSNGRRGWAAAHPCATPSASYPPKRRCASSRRRCASRSLASSMSKQVQAGSTRLQHTRLNHVKPLASLHV